MTVSFLLMPGASVLERAWGLAMQTIGLIKETMARPLRLEFSDSICHLTSRGNTRQRSFFSDTDRASFLNTLSQVISRYRCICHAYCLMANHYHLLIETPKPSHSTGLVEHPELVADRHHHVR